MNNIKLFIEEELKIVRRELSEIEQASSTKQNIKKRNILRDMNDAISLKLECIEGYNFSDVCYIIVCKYENEIVMTMMCFPNSNKIYQFNMCISKFPSTINRCPKNISLDCHSYTCSLFDCEYMITKPLKKMDEILVNGIPNILKFNQDDDTFLGFTRNDFDNHMGIGEYENIYAVKITDEFKERYKTSPVTFEYHLVLQK